MIAYLPFALETPKLNPPSERFSCLAEAAVDFAIRGGYRAGLEQPHLSVIGERACDMFQAAAESAQQSHRRVVRIAVGSGCLVEGSPDHRVRAFELRGDEGTLPRKGGSFHPSRHLVQAMVQRMGESNRLLGKAKRHTRDQLMALGRYPFIENAIHEQNLKLLALFYLHGSGLFLQDDETQEVFLPLM
jgi:hypothetical protein